MNLTFQFDAAKAGKMCQAPGGDWRLSLIDGSLGNVSASYEGQEYNNTEFTLTGWYFIKNGKTYYQEEGGYWVQWTTDAVLFNDTPAKHSSTATYALIKKIINNNKHILENNLLCAKYSGKLTEAQKGRLYDLQLRLQHRDTMLRNKSIMESVTTSYPKGYVTWSSYLDSFMEYGRVGAVGTIAVIVVAVVVLAAMISAAYYAYKYYVLESEQDVKYSDELTKILAEKLTPAEYEQLKKETSGMITKAKILARIGGAGTFGKAALLGLGLLAVYKVVSPGSKSSSNTNKRRKE